MSVKANIPVKPYIKRYLINTFGTPAVITKGSVIGKMLFLLVENPAHTYNYQFKSKRYSEIITFQISDNISLRSGWFLTPTNITLFNCFCEGLIKERMLYDLSNWVNEGMKLTQAIDKYWRLNNFDEKTFPFDTIKKAYQRHLKEISEGKANY